MSDISRQGLLVWMRNIVEEGKCQGVEWENQDEETFRIPWGNQKSRCWKEEDCSVFLEYAKYTGKYKPGDKMDFPRWKQNLKSAINKNRFIERLTKKDRLGGTKPYRVYKFTDREGSKKKRDGSLTPDLPLKEVRDNGSWSRQSPFDEGGNVTSSRHDSTESSLSRSLDSRSETKSSSPASSPGLDFLCSPLSPHEHGRNEACERQFSNIPTIIEDEDIGVLGNQNNCETGDNFELHASDTMVVSPAMTAPPITAQTDTRSFQTYPELTPMVGGGTLILVSDKQSQPAAPVISFPLPSVFNQQSGQEQIFGIIRRSTGDTFSTANNVTQNNIQTYHVDPMSTTGHSSSQAFSNLQSSVSGLQMSCHLTPSAAGDSVTQSAVFQTRHCDANQASGATAATTVFSETNDVVMQDSQQPMSSSSLSMYLATSDLHSTSTFGDPQSTAHRDSPKATVVDAVDNKEPLIHLQILYGTPHRVVKKMVITSPVSRIYFGTVPHKKIQAELQGPKETLQIELPKVDSWDLKEERKARIREILDKIECGVVITYRDGDIYVERKCLPRVYISDGVKTSTPLSRSSRKRPNVETKAFDLKEFQSKMESHKQNSTEVPRDHFLLTFGHEILQNDDSPTRSVPMYAVVRHVLAGKERYDVLGVSALSSTNCMMSDPDSFDYEISLAKKFNSDISL